MEELKDALHYKSKKSIQQELKQARDELLHQFQQKHKQRDKGKKLKSSQKESIYSDHRISARKLKKKVKQRKVSKHKSKKKKSQKEIEQSERKKSKRISRRRKSSSSSDSTDSSSSKSDISSNTEEEEWTEAAPATLQRENWMISNDLHLKTYSREKKTESTMESNRAEAYDPVTSVRELNPYWKTTGTGLPEKSGFLAPRTDSDQESSEEGGGRLLNSKCKDSIKVDNIASSGSKGWKRRTSNDKQENIQPIETTTSPTPTEEEVFLNDQQMNELGAKMIKAEIMGNDELAAELRRKLDRAKQTRINNKKKGCRVEEEQHILLTHTDAKGNSRPLQQSRSTGCNSTMSNRNGRKRRVETHSDGQRMRYFADDTDDFGKYDLKTMFQKEKYSKQDDDNKEFANVVEKSKGNLEDLDDIFVESISHKSTDETERSEKREMDIARREQQHLERMMDNCNRCLDSEWMQRELLITVANQLYLALPWFVGLQAGHCLLTTRQHISCCTQLDEDAWCELTDFRRALVKMFAAQGKDVIFVEMAKKLRRRGHLAVHCIPVSNEKAEMVPLYFKKAIEESEYEWCVNKQLISLQEKSLVNVIPKGLPYFWVQFGMDSGFAHVIEDEERFPDNFAFVSTFSYE